MSSFGWIPQSLREKSSPVTLTRDNNRDNSELRIHVLRKNLENFARAAMSPPPSYSEFEPIASTEIDDSIVLLSSPSQNNSYRPTKQDMAPQEEWFEKEFEKLVDEDEDNSWIDPSRNYSPQDPMPHSLTCSHYSPSPYSLQLPLPHYHSGSQLSPSLSEDRYPETNFFLPPSDVDSDSEDDEDEDDDEPLTPFASDPSLQDGGRANHPDIYLDQDFFFYPLELDLISPTSYFQQSY